MAEDGLGRRIKLWEYSLKGHVPSDREPVWLPMTYAEMFDGVTNGANVLDLSAARVIEVMANGGTVEGDAAWYRFRSADERAAEARSCGSR